MKKKKKFLPPIKVIMKLSVLQLAIVILTGVSTYAYDARAQELLMKKVSLNLHYVDLKTALVQIENAAGVKFVYGTRSLPLKRKVSIVVINKSVAEVLDELFSPDKISYKIVREKIVLSVTPQDGHGFHSDDINRNEGILVERVIKGKVFDPNGDVLPGVNIILKGSQRGTTTDINGEYELQIPEGRQVLVFSFVGYLTQETETGLSDILEITLKVDEKSLEEVVVVGYGTQQREDISGAVSNISAKDLHDMPVAQLAQKLQGKLSGVRVDQVSGRPGEGMRITVRGAVSITAGAEPLYVVDGMPISGNINNINPSEIETISVLKDASAAALYGSRAANGVILIQTKTATPGKTQIELESYYGFERVPESRKLKMMNAEQYAQFQKEIAELNGREVHPIFQNPSQYRGKGTDWYDVVTKTGAIQSHNLTVRAGVKNFSSSVTAGYFKQEGVVIGTGYERYSLRVNTIFTPTERLKIGFNIAPTFSLNNNFATDGNPYGSENIVSSALATTPLASPYNEDGTLALTAADPATFGNPNWLRVAKEKVYKNENLQLLSNLFAEYQFTRQLKFRTGANTQIGNANLYQFNPSTIGVLFTPPPRIPFGSENSSKSLNWQSESSLSFMDQIGDHAIDALVNFTAQKYTGSNTVVNGNNFASDKIRVISAAGNVTVSSSVQEWALLSYLARLNYSYKGRYLLTASVRRDGSSRFGPNNRWGNFPSASVGWILSKESFWQVKPISFFKVRASYGITGNFEIGNYTFRSTIAPVYYPFNNALYQGMAANNLGDANLGWERKKQVNIGADVYLFDDRIQLSYNYYNTNSSDILFNVPVPKSSGFNNIQTNIGELKLWGHEISVNSYNLRTSDFSWNTALNVSFDRNRVSRLATQEADALYHGISSYGFFSHRSQIGQPVGQFYGAIQEGVYMNQEDFNSSPKYADSQVGTIKFKDLNNDGVISFPEDYTTIGTPWPDFIFGITNDIRYKNFDLGVTITGSYGNQILAHHENWTTNLDGVFNVLEEVKDRWKSPEDPGAGKYGSTQQGTTYLERDRWHSRFVKDGSFVNFKNITLGFSVPVTNLRFVSRLRIYTSVQNALVLTNYTGPNPEVNTRNTSSGSSPGVDENSYPVPRTWSFGVNIGF